jgi:EmrB/QacA subfamily drug resistance transporter
MKFSKKWSAMTVVLLGTFTLILNNSMVNVAIPNFMDVFQISSFKAQWFMTIFMIAMGVATPLSGFFGDRLGKRKTFMYAMGLFVIGSFLASFSWNAYSMMAFRSLQGAAAGIVMPLSMALIFQAVPREERGMALGIWGVASMMAPAIGPTIGGILIDFGRWQYLFLVNIPVGLMCLIAAYFLLDREENGISIHFDGKGFVLATLGILVFLLGMNQLNAPGGVTEVMNYTLMMLGVILIWWFVHHEMETEHPLLNFRIFGQKAYRYSVWVTSMQSINLFAGILLLPIFLQSYLGFSAFHTGLVILPMALMSGIGMTIGGRILDRIGPSFIVPGGLIVLTLMNAAMFWVDQTTSMVFLLILLSLRGLSIGFVGIPATTMGMNTVPADMVSRASAINHVLRQIFAALGVVVIILFYEFRLSTLGLSSTGKLQPITGIIGIQESFLILAIFSALTIPMAFRLGVSYRENLKLHKVNIQSGPGMQVSEK